MDRRLKSPTCLCEKRRDKDGAPARTVLLACSAKEKCPGLNLPCGERPGHSCFNLRLLRCEVLVIAQADDVLEHRCAWGQVVRVQELRIEEIVTHRRAIHDIA